MNKIKWIPQPSDCAKCKKCYHQRLEEMMAICFMLGMAGAIVLYQFILHTMTR